MQKVPKAIAAAMLAGVLLRWSGRVYCLAGAGWLVGGMLLGFLLLRRHAALCRPLTLLIGLALAAAQV